LQKVTPEQVFVAMFLVMVLVYGAICAATPERVLAFRRRHKWSTSFWTGGYFYSSVARIRAMGILLSAVCVSLIAVLVVEVT
jgi:hypothetical protein